MNKDSMQDYWQHERFGVHYLRPTSNNADGGVIIVGIEEAKKGARTYPERIDDGVPASDVTVTWLSQIIQSNIDPLIPDLRVHEIPLSGDRQGQVIFILHVPRGTRAVQASDMRFYQRIDDRSLPMKDFQIRDVNNRLEGPDLRLNLRFPAGRGGQLITGGKGKTEQVVLEVTTRSLAENSWP